MQYTTKTISSQAPALQLKSVSKKFNDITAIDNLTLEIKKGEIIGLLGPNGAGKSTLIKTILGLVKPDSGSIKVLEFSVPQDTVLVKQHVGYVPEHSSAYEFLTGIEFLDFAGDIFQMEQEEKKKRINEFLKALNLEGREGDMISSYSGGMKKKILIISALMHKPELLLLDEPLNTLDPKSARIIKNLIQQLSQQNVTTIIATHILEIAEAVCSRIAIMYEGKLLALGTMDELRQQAKMPNSGLEDIFLKLTGTEDVQLLVEELTK
ncbi:MAG: ABC transporter ATP-binding protein [Nitrososphaerota archaeon]|jgi:ABC-2 type transport system ATP-binding protein|nr:ABC transporter ATP-binding protein [Nitrososphaerota archaeon]